VFQPGQPGRPLPLERPRERFLPERTFALPADTGLQYALLAAAAPMTGPNRTRLMRSLGDRPTSSGSTPCSRRSPTSAPPPSSRASRYARHAGTSERAPWPPGTITTSSGRSRSGYLTAGRPIITKPLCGKEFRRPFPLGVRCPSGAVALPAILDRWPSSRPSVAVVLPHLQVVRPRFAAGAPPGPAASPAAVWQRSGNGQLCPGHGRDQAAGRRAWP
jgi:hypothetical protein